MSGSSTLCSEVARASRLNVWKTNPISLLRMRANWSSSSSLTNWPLSQYLPFDGVSRQPIRFISVDLPDPDGPMMATYSLCLMRSVIPLSACTCCSEPMSYVRHRSSTTITSPLGGVAGCATSSVLMLSKAIPISSSASCGPVLSVQAKERSARAHTLDYAFFSFRFPQIRDYGASPAGYELACEGRTTFTVSRFTSAPYLSPL